jgi:hypothetical protein
VSLVARLIEAGTPPDLVEEVAMALARAQVFEEAIEKRRANDRERQARRNVNSREVTITHVRPVEKENPPDPKKEKPTPLNGSPKGEPIPPPIEPDLCPEHVLEAWNAMADRTGVPKAKLTPERRKKLSTFIRRHPVDDITEAISAIERSAFLRGENDRSWRADFNWMLEPRNFTKLTEGTYDR